NDVPDFFRMCFEALGDVGARVVLACGKRISDDALKSAPSSFVVARSVPQLDVLERASVFVTHGGMGSVMEALYFGVPMVVVPHNFEQGVTAKRVAELGLGVALDPS